MLAADSSLIPTLVSAIYDAALEPQSWPLVLEGLCDATQSVGAMLISMDLRQPRDSRVVFARLDPTLMNCYLRNHAAVDPWTAVATGLPVGRAFALDSFVPQRTLLRSALYAEILQGKDIRHALTSILCRDRERVAAVSLYRTGRRGAFECVTRERMDALMPHLLRAENIGSRLGDALANQASMSAALHALTQGVALLDARARVLFANRRAEVLFSSGNGLRVVGGRLCATSAADAKRLAALLLLVAKGGGGSMRVARAGCERPVLLRAARVADGMADAVHPATRVVVLLTEGDAGPGADTRAAAQLFELTPAEARVAGGVASGHGVPQLARMLGLSPNTVHTHLRRLFAKCGVHSQVGLASVLQRVNTFNAGSEFTRSCDDSDRREAHPRRQ